MVDIVMKEKETGKLNYLLGFTGAKGSAMLADVMQGDLKMVPLVTFIDKYVADEDGYCECGDCEDFGDDELEVATPRVYDDSGKGILIEVPVADGVSITMAMDDGAAQQFVTLVSNKLNSRWKK